MKPIATKPRSDSDKHIPYAFDILYIDFARLPAYEIVFFHP